jgi:hypothetical protein
MDNTHITHILEEKPLTAFSESELGSIRAHTANCADCARAFEAAQLSQLLIKSRADEAAASALNANPFFQTRVLARGANSAKAAGVLAACGRQPVRW